MFGTIKRPVRTLESMEKVFQAIRRVRASYPDLRVGQIIGGAERDPFYVEDEDLARRIDQLAAGIKENTQ